MIDAYRNLRLSKTRPYVYSIRDVETGRVVGHTSDLLLEDATFRVSEPGRQRVLRERRKNVHATIRGRRALLDEVHLSAGWSPVVYDPYANSWFVDGSTGKEVFAAPFVLLTSVGVYYLTQIATGRPLAPVNRSAINLIGHTNVMPQIMP